MVLIKRVIHLFFFFLNVIFVSGQTMEVVVKNNSPLPDSLIYIAVIGEDLSGPPGKFVWINLENGDQIPMGTQYNTVDGPSYGGDQGPGQNSKYAACFFSLESLDKGSFLLQPIQGCRIFIAQKEQLYLYFFDQIDVFGYAAPNKQNPNDPNTGIIYEIIELTFNQFGFFGNTTRVDAYHRPIRMELIGENNTYRQIVGEAMSHQNIIKSFQSYAPQEFTNCLELKDSIISQPSKIKDFQGGGLHQNYFQPYVEKIWSKYRSVNLSFDSGEKGIWSGRVNEAGVLELKCIDGPGIFLDRVARIAGPPSTQEVIEGKGVLNQPIGDTEVDLAIQAQICAAINRHVINVSDENPGIQNWSNPQNFYKNEPANFYAGFWHQEGISINNLSYGFAYDDVWEQSSSLHTPDPEKLIIYFGDPNDCIYPKRRNDFNQINHEEGFLNKPVCPFETQEDYVEEKNKNINHDPIVMETIHVFPNPVNQQLKTKAEFSETMKINAYIINQRGEMVQILEKFHLITPGLFEKEYAVTSLNKGIYYLVLEDTDSPKKWTQLFVKY